MQWFLFSYTKPQMCKIPYRTEPLCYRSLLLLKKCLQNIQSIQGSQTALAVCGLEQQRVKKGVRKKMQYL